MEGDDARHPGEASIASEEGDLVRMAMAAIMQSVRPPGVNPADRQAA